LKLNRIAASIIARSEATKQSIPAALDCFASLAMTIKRSLKALHHGLGDSAMAWFLNFYRCDHCKRRWTDEWSCMSDDECPHCGSRDMTPFRSEDLTELVEQDGDEFVAIRSPDTAEHDPDYRELGRFPSLEKAEEFLASVDVR
jgi:DNA-directed RNA polymerase subunit RPC12/RpoP